MGKVQEPELTPALLVEGLAEGRMGTSGEQRLPAPEKS